MLMSAANNNGSITREQVDINLTMDCVGCDLSCKELDHSGNYDCATYFRMDFSGADLSYASLRGQHLAEVDFTGATLVGTDFSADLESENKVVTKLHRARFWNADLLDADFTGNTTAHQVEWDGARCPTGEWANDVGGTCVGYGVPAPE